MPEFLPIMLYVLGSILLIVLIILGIKLIIVMNKIDAVVDNINTKVESLNGVFSIIDSTTDKLAFLSNRVTEGITSLIRKIVSKRKEEEEDEDE